jgi:hypothetical protein
MAHLFGVEGRVLSFFHSFAKYAESSFRQIQHK